LLSCLLSPLSARSARAARQSGARCRGGGECRQGQAELGLGDDAGVSLFDDYVEKGRSDGADQGLSQDKAARFRYLHDTARVVVSLMKDIEAQVARAATEQGFDVGARGETDRAVREIVRAEVRALLPSIAREVASLVEQNESGNAAGGEGEVEAEAGERLDLDRIADDLRPTDAADRIDERI